MPPHPGPLPRGEREFHSFVRGITYLNKNVTGSPADRLISFADLDFDTIEVQCYSSSGTPYTRRIPIGMPRIPRKVLNTVFYLYKTEADAREDKNREGTGFIVALPAILPHRIFTYFVSNWHVVLDAGASVVRINKFDGTADIFPYEPTDWHFLPQYDIAVISRPLRDEHKFAIIQEGIFLRRERKEKEDIGIGDDVFMVGLFVDNQDLNKNMPALRFGNISMDLVAVEQPNKKFAESYCLDMHSRSGYSGSPVFVYRTPGYDLEEELGHGKKMKFLCSGRNHLSLLGIHYGQFPEGWPIEYAKKSKEVKREKIHCQ